MIKQISIYTENRKGALRTLVGTLAQAGVDLRALEAGYLTKLTSVLAVEVSDSVGSLAGLLDVVEAANLNINFLYAAWDRATGQPMIVLHTDDLAELESLLLSKGYRSLGRSGK